VPIPRRFDRRPPDRDDTRINERIRVREVRLVGEDGNQIGVIPIEKALEYARERDLDLVEVAADARPPVCRVLDYSKYKYELEQKAKAARKHQKQVNVREIKLRPKIANNDYETKKNHVVRFLNGDDRVKVTIMFRGREQTHPERGVALLMRLAEDVSEIGVIDQRPIQDGRNMTMLLSPVPKKVAEDEAPQTADGGDAPANEAKRAEVKAPAKPKPAGTAAAEAETPAAEAKPAEADAPVVEAEAPAAEAEAPAAEAKPAKAKAPASKAKATKTAAKPAEQAPADDADAS
jgi:translation initiation factor IF-3